MKIYLAGPIFFYGDYLRNIEWANRIREAFPDVDLYSPVENTEINGVEGKKKFAGSQEIANGDNIRLDNTDVLIACIDGDVLPSGTCAEIGKFHEKIARGDNKYIIGICTLISIKSIIILVSAIILIVTQKIREAQPVQVSSNTLTRIFMSLDLSSRLAFLFTLLKK